MKKLIVILFIITTFVIFPVTVFAEEIIITAKDIKSNASQKVREYEIVETEDLTIKALDKPLSQYSTAELCILPTNVRKVYRILVPSDISKKELITVLTQIVVDKTSENKNIDVITVFAYDRQEDINSAFTFGMVRWCPNGDWNGVTSKIALTNDRSLYKYVFEIKNRVGGKNRTKSPTHSDFVIYDDFNTLYRAISINNPHIIVDEELILQKTAKKHKISKEEVKEVITKILIYQFKD